MKLTSTQKVIQHYAVAYLQTEANVWYRLGASPIQVVPLFTHTHPHTHIHTHTHTDYPPLSSRVVAHILSNIMRGHCNGCGVPRLFQNRYQKSAQCNTNINQYKKYTKGRTWHHVVAALLRQLCTLMTFQGQELWMQTTERWVERHDTAQWEAMRDL